jgi:hypothetical protein
MRARAALLAGALLLPACAARPDALLRVTCPVDAQLYVDDVFAAPLSPRRGVTLKLLAGTHRIEVRAEGRLSAYREIDLAHRANARMHVEPRPDPGDHFEEEGIPDAGAREDAAR